YNKGWEEKMVKSGVIKDGAIKIDSTNGNIFPPLGSEEEYVYEFTVGNSEFKNIFPLIKHNHGLLIDLTYKDSYNEKSNGWHKSSYFYNMNYSEKLEPLCRDKPLLGNYNITINRILSHRYVKNVSYEKAKERILRNPD
ncbi:MAG: hypothetical protein ACXQS3_02880, partial [Candidatus Methanofastidiosia archaeon]